MRYAVTTFKVRLEVSDSGDRTAASEDAVRIAKPIFADLDADKEHFVVLALNNKNRVNDYKVTMWDVGSDITIITIFRFRSFSLACFERQVLDLAVASLKAWGRPFH